jgi:Flp pilus assembly protein TadG
VKRRSLRRLLPDAGGATVVEFAIVAPVMCMFIVGAFDLGHTLYTRAALQGVVQKTARDSTLESSTTGEAQAALDKKVKDQVMAFANNATVTIKRRYYRSFVEAQAAQAEAWTDNDGNGTCNGGEPYQDENLNSTWDRDGGDSGQGSAKDRTVYTVTMSYPRMFPIHRFVRSMSDETTLTASTVLENQPYSDQQSYGAPVVRNCP